MIIKVQTKTASLTRPKAQDGTQHCLVAVGVTAAELAERHVVASSCSSNREVKKYKAIPYGFQRERREAAVTSVTAEADQLLSEISSLLSMEMAGIAKDIISTENRVQELREQGIKSAVYPTYDTRDMALSVLKGWHYV
jgi:hypothetical protein